MPDVPGDHRVSRQLFRNAGQLTTTRICRRPGAEFAREGRPMPAPRAIVVSRIVVVAGLLGALTSCGSESGMPPSAPSPPSPPVTVSSVSVSGAAPIVGASEAFSAAAQLRTGRRSVSPLRRRGLRRILPSRPSAAAGSSPAWAPEKRTSRRPRQRLGIVYRCRQPRHELTQWIRPRSGLGWWRSHRGSGRTLKPRPRLSV
jgi:hypothetical protein